MAELYTAQFPADLSLVRNLFQEYAQSLGIDLCFQDFEAELATLPGKYAEPSGRVLIARLDGQVMGCVALRPLETGICEMKRLYVRPQGRGHGIGWQLAGHICAIAKDLGYTHIRLDTLADMHAALRVYARLGFRPIQAYVFNPIAGATYLELDLRPSASAN